MVQPWCLDWISRGHHQHSTDPKEMKSKNDSAQKYCAQRARDDSVALLGKWRFPRNGDGILNWSTRKEDTSQIGGRHRFLSHTPNDNVVSSDNSTNSGGSKNEDIKRFAVKWKCLAINKKSNLSEKLERLLLELDSHLVQAPRWEEAMAIKTTRMNHPQLEDSITRKCWERESWMFSFVDIPDD